MKKNPDNNTVKNLLYKDIDFSKLTPDDFEICPHCSQLKIMREECRVCAEWQVEEIVKILKSKTDARRLKVVEERILEQKKSPNYNKVYSDDFLPVFFKKNRRNQLSLISTPTENPDRIIMTNMGGVHKISHAFFIDELEHILRMAKINYKLVTGKRYRKKNKKKMGRPRKKSAFYYM